MQIINDWLTGKRLYSYGVILYNRFGTDENLKSLFALGETHNTKAKLFTALKELCYAEPGEALPKRETTADVMPVSTNKVLEALRHKWMPLYTEMNYKRHQLDQYLFINSDAAMLKRGKLAMEILQLEKQCMAIWAQRDHYLTFGKLPHAQATEKTEPIIDPMAMAMQYKNVQSYIRRYRGQLNKNASNANAAANLTKYEQQLEQLKQQINAAK